MNNANPNANANNGPAAPAPGQDPGAITGALACPNPQCVRREGMLKGELDRIRREKDQLRQQFDEKSAEAARLQEENQKLRDRLNGVGKRHERTWPKELRKYLQNNHPEQKEYAKIYRLSCKEENMSSRLDTLHPNLKLVAPHQLDDSDSEDGDEAPQLVAALPARMDVLVRQDERPFPFERLPWEAQVKVFTFLLKVDGLIHCLSRLDPFVQPDDFPTDEELGPHCSGLKNVFFWGESRECSISNDGKNPNEVLAALSVSKRWYWIGVHVFYGSNTFAFSSLGEFGRFCQGIGPARLARVQHIELLPTGSQWLTAPRDSRGKSPFSRRTYPLTWLCEMYRLKTLVVHINESGVKYARRKYENPAIKQLLAAKTAGQPNARMTRALRCVQGMDYIYNLRGMEWIRWYDFNKALKAKQPLREPVKDWSFVDDVTNVCTMPKPPKRQADAELEKLKPLLPDDDNWEPSKEDWEMVKSVYIDSNGRCSYDEMRVQRQQRDADIASYLSVAGTGTVDISSDSSSGLSSDDNLTSGVTSDDDDSDSDLSDDDGGDSPIEISSDDDANSSSSSSSSDDDSDSDDSITGSRSHSTPSPSRTRPTTLPNPSRALTTPAKRESTPRNFAIPSRPASRTPAPARPRNRRESTDSLFVMPGPPHPFRNSFTPIRNSPLGTPARDRRESTTSGLFVTPGPSFPAPPPPPRRRRGQGTPNLMNGGSDMIDLTGDADDEDNLSDISDISDISDDDDIETDIGTSSDDDSNDEMFVSPRRGVENPLAVVPDIESSDSSLSDGDDEVSDGDDEVSDGDDGLSDGDDDSDDEGEGEGGAGGIGGGLKRWLPRDQDGSPGKRPRLGL